MRKENAVVMADEQNSAQETSETLNCYIFGKSLCDKSGNAITEYVLDEAGNIVDGNGNIVIQAENAVKYSYVTGVNYSRGELHQKLSDWFAEDGHVVTKPTNFKITLMVDPPAAINNTILLESYDPGTLYFPTEENKGILASESAAASGESELSKIAVVPDKNGRVEITFTGVAEGSVDVSILNALHEEIRVITIELDVDMSDVDVGNEPDAGDTAIAKDQGKPASNGIVSTANGSSPHVHSFKDQVMEPTVRTQGYTLHTCTICGYSYRDSFVSVMAHTHDWRAKTVVPPTYTSSGYTIYECVDCHQQERRDITNPLVCNHANIVSKVVAPTCTTSGYTLHECLTCGKYRIRTDETAALDHNWDAGTVIREATCQQSGILLYRCLREGCTATRESSAMLPALEHQWDEGVITDAPTCTLTGTKTYTCQVGGETKTETLPVLEHDWDEGVVISDPSCEAEGEMQYLCRNCGAVRTEAIPATGHSWAAGEIIAEATCSAEGSRAVTCLICGATETESIPTTPHAMVEETVDPTYTSGGYTRHYCTVCGYEGEHTDLTEPIPHEHNFIQVYVEPTCLSGGYSYFVCTVCGERSQEQEFFQLGHDYVLSVINATEASAGYLCYTCTRCGDVYATGYTKAIPEMILMDEPTLNPDAVVAAGNNWLSNNSFQLDAGASVCGQEIRISKYMCYEYAESLMLDACLNTAYAVLTGYTYDGRIPYFYCQVVDYGDEYGFKCCYVL